MCEPEMLAVADMISEVLLDITNPATAAKVLDRVKALTARFPCPTETRVLWVRSSILFRTAPELAVKRGVG